MSGQTAVTGKKPWHVWAVGLLTLLWDGSGALTIVLAQQGRLNGISADEAAYYAAQPLWFVLVTDFSLLTALAAGIAVLLQSRHALWLFRLSLLSILATNAWDLAQGSSRALANSSALIVTIIIVVLAVLQLIYARVMTERGLLK